MSKTVAPNDKISHYSKMNVSKTEKVRIIFTLVNDHLKGLRFDMCNTYYVGVEKRCRGKREFKRKSKRLFVHLVYYKKLIEIPNPSFEYWLKV